MICCFRVLYSHFIQLHNRFGFAHIGRVGSVFANLMVTIERFVAVWCPLQRLKSTKTLLSISIIGSLIYNISRFLEFESTTVYVNRYHHSYQPPSQPLPIINHSYVDNMTLSNYESNNLENVIKVKYFLVNEIPDLLAMFFQIYILWMKLIIIELIPYFVIVILNSCMACR